MKANLIAKIEAMTKQVFSRIRFFYFVSICSSDHSSRMGRNYFWGGRYRSSCPSLYTNHVRKPREVPSFFRNIGIRLCHWPFTFLHYLLISVSRGFRKTQIRITSATGGKGLHALSSHATCSSWTSACQPCVAIAWCQSDASGLQCVTELVGVGCVDPR